MPSGNWTDANVQKFIMYMCFALSSGSGTPTQQFPIIAEKLGPEFTVSACSNKWQRLKSDFEKENGSVSNIVGAGTPKKGSKSPVVKKTPKATDSEKSKSTVIKDEQLDGYEDGEDGEKSPITPALTARKRGRPAGAKAKDKDAAKTKDQSPLKRKETGGEHGQDDGVAATKKVKIEAGEHVSEEDGSNGGDACAADEEHEVILGGEV